MLNPLSWLYPLGAAFHRSLYQCGFLNSHRLECPVFCVGNITSGGTGKTSIVHRLVKDLLSLGKHPAILTRGYKRRRDGEGPLVVLAGSRSVEETGDEAKLLSTLLPETPVVISANRALGGRLAIENHRADCLVLDDGFQHWGLQRNLDIVCVDGLRPFGGGLKEPKCFLRERPASLRRADLLVITKVNLMDPSDLSRLKEELAQRAPGTPIVEAAYRASLINPPDGPSLQTLAGRKVLAVSGIGSPRSFEALLHHLGGSVVDRFRFPDHHAFATDDLKRIRSRADREGLTIATTEKDSCRIPDLRRFYTVHIDIEFVEGEPYWHSALLEPWRS